jgi:hypothetical protein
MRRNTPDGMWRVGCAPGGAAFAAVLAWAMWLLFESVDPTRRAAREAAALRTQRLAEDAYGADLAAVVVLRLGLSTAVVVVALGGAVLALVTAYRRWGAPSSVRADKITALAVAQSVPQFPNLTHLHLSGGAAAAQLPQFPAGDETPALAPAQLPGYTDLATLGFTPSSDRILLGLAPGGELVTVGARQLCHVAMLGATGVGKSNLLRLLLPQLQAVGAQVILADPHYARYDPESGDDWSMIESRLHMAPAHSPSAIAAAFGYLSEQLHRRLELRREGRPLGKPLFLALDELLVIADVVPSAIDTLSQLLREGRKVGVYAVGASQSMLVKVLGGDSAARECYRTAIYGGGDMRSAAALLDVPQRQLPESELGNGIVMLRSVATRPAALVRVPLASNAGIARLLGAPSVSTSPEPAWSAEHEAAHEGAATIPLRGHCDAVQLTPEDAQIVEGFKAGKSASDLAQELSGGKKGGAAYQKASGVVAAALRRALGEGVDNDAS